MLEPRPREERRPSEHALLALQRSAGNAAVARAVLARDDIVSDPAALAKVESLPAGVLSGNSGHALASSEQKQHFLRAGKDLFGDYDKALAWFAAIRDVKIPGGAMLHESAAGRIEAVSTAMGAEMPKGYGGFQFRNDFGPASKFSRLSHHTLGLAIDYDPRDMVRIGQNANPNESYSVSADLIRIVTGEVPNAELGGAHRETIRKLGEATAAGKEAKTVAGGEALLAKIGTETERMGTASAEFQASLGKTRDTFLQLRKDYLTAKAGTPARKEVMAKVPDAIAPWLDAIEKGAQKLRDEAKTAGFDPDALDPAALRKQAAELDAIVAAGTKLRATYSSDPTQPLGAKHEAQVAGWETKLGITTDTTAAGYTRIDLAVTMASGKSGQLKDLFGHGPRLKQLAELKKRLTTDAQLLFGSSANKTEDTPPLAQLVESGFFTPGTPGASGDDRGNFNAKFIQEMARHGFDTGSSWGGAFTDSMHFELVTNLF